jgi:ATP-dependent Clp protease protease subunit
MGNEIKEIFNYCYEDKYYIEEVKERKLFLNNEVEEYVIGDLVRHILRYNRLDKGLPPEERKPIIIYINTPGGVVTDGYCLIDAIISSKTPVYTVNIGTAYSMGFLIFIAGHKRIAMPNSTFLCHDGSSFAWDSTNKLKDRVDFEAGEMEEHTKNFIISRTNIDSDLYEKNKRKEWYFYPEEAKRLGVATHIVGEDCDIDFID